MRLFTHLTAVAVAIMIGAPAAMAKHCNDVTRETTGEIVAADALLARPVGIAATAVGAVLYAVTLPFTLIAGGEDAVRERLVEDPANYTFTRCLGDFRYRRYGADAPGKIRDK